MLNPILRLSTTVYLGLRQCMVCRHAEVGGRFGGSGVGVGRRQGLRVGRWWEWCRRWCCWVVLSSSSSWYGLLYQLSNLDQEPSTNLKP